MQPHRHPHYNPPGSNGQNLHQDGGKRWSHHTRRLLVFYYPQDTPIARGPTGVVPVSHYFSTQEGSKVSPEQPITGKAGTVAFANYDLWHRAMPNQTEERRYMMKFLYARMTEPLEPTWENREKLWSNGTAAGPAEHQEMFRHLWNWHLGHKGEDVSTSPNGASLSELITAMNSETESTGLQAAYNVSKFGEEAVKPLVRCLYEEADMARRNACYALNAVGIPAVNSLKNALQDAPDHVRANAAEALGDLGTRAESAVPALIEALQDDSTAVQVRAIEALGTTSQTSACAVEELTKALADDNEGIRRTAVFAISRIGEHAAEAVEGLENLLFDDNRYIRGNAVHALHRIGTSDAKDVLLRYLQTTRWCPITNRDSTF